MSVPQLRKMTAEEYLTLERSSQDRHEFYQGERFALAGASRRHNMLSGRLFAALLAHLDGNPCYPYMAELRLRIEAHGHYVYPDVMVVCGEQAYVDDDMANDATVIVEVLSPHTESYDRGRKFLHYQSLASFQEYVLVSQDMMLVEMFSRRDGGEWTYHAFSQPNDILRFASIDFTCSLAELYQSLPS